MSARILDDEAVRGLILRAWQESEAGTEKAHEEGGFIYYKPTTGTIAIRRVAPGTRNSIDLSNPLPVEGTFLVATYHTHPTPPGGRVTAEPSDLDWKYANESGVPWFVISHEGNYVAGPDRRFGGCVGNPLYPND